MFGTWIKHTIRFRVLCILVLCGCASGPDPSTTAEQGTMQAADTGEDQPSRQPLDPGAFPLASHLNEQYSDDLPGLLERRYIRILTTFNKTNFFLAGSRLYGFEYSVLKEYGKSLNQTTRKKDLKVVLEFIPVARDQLIPRLVEGFGDIAAAGLTVIPERQEHVSFTDPYLVDVDEVVVTHQALRNLEILEDLSGLNVYVRQSSSYYESLVALNLRFSEKGIPPVHIMKADESLETEDILEMVNVGVISITIVDSTLAELWASVFENIRVLSHL